MHQPEKQLKDKNQKNPVKCNSRCLFSVSLVLLNIDSGDLEVGSWRYRMSCVQELEHLSPHICA